MRGAHGISKEGAPCGKRRAAKCGMRAATSPTLNKCQTNAQGERRVRHLLRVWAATSRVRHLSKRGTPHNRHVLQLERHLINQPSITLSLSPLTPCLIFSFILSSILSPHIFFIFALADFY
jgi:hypothetical protein